MAPQLLDLYGRGAANANASSNKTTAEAPIMAASRHLLKPNGSILGRDVADCILPQFPTFCSAIPQDMVPPRPAVASIDGRVPVDHGRIHDFVMNDFGPALHQLGFGRGDRVALVLPNGPELALAIVSTLQWASCVPLSANGAVSEMEADLLRCGADLVIGPYSGTIINHHQSSSSSSTNDRFHVLSGAKNDWTVFRHVEDSAKRLGIPFLGLIPSPNESGIFKLVPTRSEAPLHFDAPIDLMLLRQQQTNDAGARLQPNGASDEVLVLFTSGTTGNKKLVPHLLGDMLTAAATIALSWDLTATDVNCNLMPLFHVGGIVRQVFSPILSGSCVICCPSFDPSIFWALLEKKAFTWYYAAPTIHQLVLQTGKQLVDDSKTLTLEERVRPELRMIANAAGGLLPSLARQLRDMFGASILPSYGMTECMPISSPPANYQLDRPGTSGVAVGPEVAILNTFTAKPLETGEEGPICVRGEPCFRGYGQIANDSSQPTADAFLKGGWFNTGDLGYMDEDGFLYITGRSKEVINRGGEIISPVEVEEAVVSHPDISTCCAFSAPHAVLQEVVGIVIVMSPERPRLDLPSLHEYLGERLAAPKWPQCMVFMGGLPKSHTNKLLRVKLGSRFGIPELNDDMAPVDRTYEAKCPPQGTSLDVHIPIHKVTVSADDVREKLTRALITSVDQQLLVVPHPLRSGSLACYVLNVDRVKAVEVARDALERYAVPSHFVVLSQPTQSENELPLPTAMDATASILQSLASAGPIDPLAEVAQTIFVDLLVLDYVPAPDANFFHLGGSSMMASQLASRIRKRFAVPCSGADIFHHASCNDLAKMIRQRGDDSGTEDASDLSGSNDDSSTGEKSVDTHGAPFSPTRIAPQGSLAGALFQLVPMFVVFPVWQVTRYLLFFLLLLWSTDRLEGDRDLGRFVLVYIFFHLCWVTITPLVFVGIKWIVIGRYKSGRYPLWGSYYLRWWFVDICRKLFLRGIWGSNEHFLNFYYRLLGAKIGKGARISLEADVSEFDLIEVGDNAALEFCTFRAFGVDNGAMILGPVKVGNDASVGARSVVAPYTSVPDGRHLGPVTSTYDGKALDPKHARVNRRILPEPNLLTQVFVGFPIHHFVTAFSQIPPLVVLFCMLRYKGNAGEAFTTLGDLMQWLCDPARIPFYIGIRVSRQLLGPFFYMAAAIPIKKFVIGKFEEGPRNTDSQWELTRYWLAATLFSRKKMQDVTDIVGRHYELVSALYRLLGAKVGKRVFWPGHQPVFSGEFDLLEIGDDVVFGSRSSLFCTTSTSSEKIILCAGSNVADNCVVLPGSIIGKNAVLGSNSVCPRGWYLPESSVWFGSKGCEPDCLESGVDVVNVRGHREASKVNRASLPMVGDASTLRPFGRAFYMRQATYFVWPLSWIIAFSVVSKALITMFHTLPLLGALHGAAALLYGLSFVDRDYDGTYYSFPTIYRTVLCVFFWTHLCRVATWMAIELTAKWTIIGRRQEGRFNYDTSSYAQRWELYQLIGKVRKFNRLNFLDFFSGTPLLALYFRWNGSTVGRDVCLYPAGADPFMPEPDLVNIGDRCVVDCASIVCHLNTRGNFELVKIIMEDNCTLRTRSRIQQGVYMEHGSMLLEKSLAMTGEVIEASSVWQGGPASWWFQYSTKSAVPYASAADEDDDEDEDNVDKTHHDESTKLLQGCVSSYA